MIANNSSKVRVQSESCKFRISPTGCTPITSFSFEDAYHHEQLVTSWIYELVDIAVAEKDHATNNLLQWFVNEQVEEEANTSLIVDKLKLIGNDTHGLFMIDSELGARATAPETAPKQ